MNVDKDMLKSFRKDFAEAVKSLEAKYGMAISMGNISFTANSFRTKMEAIVTDASTQSGANYSPELAKMKVDFMRYAKLVGMEGCY